jgi:DNA topoisomerase-1
VTNSGINATIPDVKNPEELTLAEAVELIEARAEKTGAKPAPRRKGPRKSDSARIAKPAEAAAKPAKTAKLKKKAAPKGPRKSSIAAE